MTPQTDSRLEMLQGYVKDAGYKCHIVKSKTLSDESSGFNDAEKGCWIMHRNLFQV